jgi:arabinosaccharide transport system permease protein
MRKQYSKSQIYQKILSYALFVVIALFILIPLYALFIATFKDGTDMIQHGLNLKIQISKMNLKNYVMLFSGQAVRYWIWYRNSMILTVVQVFLTLFISSCVAYGFAAYDFPLKNILFIFVLIVMSIPFEILMLPLYQQINDMKLSDTYFAILIPFLAQASTIFFFRQYIIGIPHEITEAGRIDGATEYGIYIKLILPIMKPSFAAMAIMNGMNSWNNFLWPLLVLRSDNKYTLPIGLNTLITPYGNNYDLLIVGSFVAIIPIVILFLAFQKYFIEGMTAGAVKG